MDREKLKKIAIYFLIGLGAIAIFFKLLKRYGIGYLLFGGFILLGIKLMNKLSH